VRVDRTFRQTVTGTYPVALVHSKVLAGRYLVQLRRLVGVLHPLIVLELHRLHEDLALAALDVAEAHAAVDLRDGGRVLRTARLEQLRHARQAARDVARLVRLAADLGDGVAGEYPLAVLRREHRVHRAHEVAYPRLVLSLALPHLDVRMQLLLTILDDDALAQAGEL